MTLLRVGSQEVWDDRLREYEPAAHLVSWGHVRSDPSRINRLGGFCVGGLQLVTRTSPSRIVLSIA